MSRKQSAALDRKKLMADPVMVTTIVVLITFLTCLSSTRWPCCWWIASTVLAD